VIVFATNNPKETAVTNGRGNFSPSARARPPPRTISSGQLAWSIWLSWGILAGGSYIHKRLGSRYTPISQDVEAQSVRSSIKSEIYGVTLLALLIALAQFLANVVKEFLWWTLVCPYYPSSFKNTD